MKEGRKGIEPQMIIVMGSVLLTGVYFLIMRPHHDYNVFISIGRYYLKCLLPVMLVWAGIFWVLKIREMTVLLSTVSLGVSLAYGLRTYGGFGMMSLRMAVSFLFPLIGIVGLVGVMLYQLWKDRTKMTEGWFGTGLFAAGMLSVIGMVFLISGWNHKLGVLCTSLFSEIAQSEISCFIFRTSRMGQVYYLWLFLFFAWVFYFLKMKRAQMINSVIGIFCVWHSLFELPIVTRGMFGYYSIWAEAGNMAAVMLLLFLAPLVPVIFAKVKKLPVGVFAVSLLAYEAFTITGIIERWKYTEKYAVWLTESLLIFLAFQVLLLLLAGSAIVIYLKQERSRT